jgi:hypothetical protein
MSRPQDHSAIERIMSIKNYYTIWNRTSDLPICSTTPQALRHRGPPNISNQNKLLRAVDLLAQLIQNCMHFMKPEDLRTLPVLRRSNLDLNPFL